MGFFIRDTKRDREGERKTTYMQCYCGVINTPTVTLGGSVKRLLLFFSVTTQAVPLKSLLCHRTLQNIIQR